MGDRIPRLHCATVPAVGETVALAEMAGRHVKVLRLREGAEVELYDAAGTRASAELIAVGRSGPRCVVRSREDIPCPAGRLTLLLGMTKGEKPDLVVRMATELGVHAIHLVACERSVVVDRGREGRMQRLQQIALEACGQSGNAYAPKLHGPSTLLDTAALAPQGATKLVFWERATAAVPALIPEASEVWAVVGPEGGLSEAEVNGLQEQGFAPCALHTPILRAETAAVVVSARLIERISRTSTP